MHGDNYDIGIADFGEVGVLGESKQSADGFELYQDDLILTKLALWWRSEKQQDQIHPKYQKERKIDQQLKLRFQYLQLV